MNFEVEREPRVGRENGGDMSAGSRMQEYDIILMLLRNSSASVFRPVPRPSLYTALLSALQNMSLHFGYHSVSHLDMSFLSSLPPAYWTPNHMCSSSPGSVAQHLRFQV
jgi:hypothetical protein